MSFYFLEIPETKILFNILEKEGIDARFVGGCVRDSICGLINSDLDIAINCPISDVEKMLSQNNIKCIPTGIKYGSITACVNHRHFEITELRRDEKCFGRDCITRKISSFEEDAKRRDFTMNALYVSIQGEIFDYFGGIDDLKNKRVIFIGDPEKRIKEDYLRILRYYRFCAKFGDLSNKYSEILKPYSKFISTLSIERIQKEILLILQSEYFLEIFKIIEEDKILNSIFHDLTTLNLEKIKEFDCSLECKLYLLFLFEDLINVFKLTKIQKRKIKNYKKFENESLEYCLYKNGLNFSKDMLAINFSKIYSKIFPLNFIDLPNNIKHAGKKLKLCEKKWINSNFMMTKEDCLEYIKTINNL